MEKKFHRGDRRIARRCLKAHLKGEVEVFHSQIRFRDKEDSWLWLDVTGRVIQRDENGKALRMIGMYRDITDFKHGEKEKQLLQEQFLQAQKMEAVGQLAGGVAHDFNNLLHVIYGYAELIQKNYGQIGGVFEKTEPIIKSVERGRNLVKHLMLFGRKEQFLLKPGSINEVLQKMKEVFCRLADQNIDIQYELGESLPEVNMDFGQIEQLMMNLFLNSRDAIGDRMGAIQISTLWRRFEGSVTVGKHTLLGGDYVVLKIEDSGEGIPDRIKARIFEPFFTTREVNKGTGLGLAAVYAIVEKHGGGIDFQSETGRGTVFWIFLPAVSGKDYSGDYNVNEVPEKPMVLLAEDEEDVRLLAQEILQEMGYDVITAEDGLQAVELFRRYSSKIEFLLFDVIMPRMNGPEACLEIRKISPKIPIVFATGYNDDRIDGEVIRLLKAMVLRKPYIRVQLEDAIEQAINNYSN